MKAIVPSILAAILLLGATEACARQTGSPVQMTVQVDDAGRTYLVAAPADTGVAVPLVIALHGGGGNAQTMVPRWIETAQREGFAVAFPQGVGRTPNAGTWNAGGCCGFAMTSGSDDVAFIAAIIDDVARTRRIDPARIYVTGLSNGGMMSHRIGIALAPRIAAIAVVSGAMFGDEPVPLVPLPVLIMHGVRDDIVPFNGGQSPMQLVARSQSRPFREANYAVDFWRKADGCDPTPSNTVNGDVTVETYAGCASSSEVVFYRLASAGHTWPGPVVPEAGLERARYDEIDATEIIWRFFSAHSR